MRTFISIDRNLNGDRSGGRSGCDGGDPSGGPEGLTSLGCDSSSDGKRLAIHLFGSSGGWDGKEASKTSI